MKKILKRIGLTEKEIAIYLILLEYGTRSAGFLAKKSDINRGTTYNIIELLLQKNIVYQTIKADVRNFTAFPPEKILEYLDKKAEKISNLKSDTEGIISDLKKIQDKSISLQPKFRFFEGISGMQDLLADTLNSRDKMNYAVLSMIDMYESFGEKKYEKHIQKRIKDNITLNVIRSDKKDNFKNRWEGLSQEKRSVRFMPQNATPPDMSFYLYNGNKVAFFSSKKENYGLLIESKEFYQTQKMLFDILWKASN